MFDGVLQRAAGPQRKLGRGALVSLVVHAVLVAIAVWLSLRARRDAR
jgi:protein TonB